MAPREGFFLVISPDFGPAVLESFSEMDALVARLRSLHGSPGTQVFAFSGFQLPITKEPRRIFGLDGALIPLHDIPVDIEVDESGFVGEPPPAPPVAAPKAIEFDDSDDDAADLPAADADEDEDDAWIIGPMPRR